MTEDMEKTITLNAVQIQFILTLLEYGQLHFDKPSQQIIVRQIINKILQS